MRQPPLTLDVRHRGDQHHRSHAEFPPPLRAEKVIEGRKGEGAMTYGFCPQDWSLFHAQIEKRRIELADIERVEMRPDSIQGSIAITVILRSGRVESWNQHQGGVGASWPRETTEND